MHSYRSGLVMISYLNKNLVNLSFFCNYELFQSHSLKHTVIQQPELLLIFF